MFVLILVITAAVFAFVAYKIVTVMIERKKRGRQYTFSFSADYSPTHYHNGLGYPVKIHDGHGAPVILQPGETYISHPPSVTKDDDWLNEHPHGR